MFGQDPPFRVPADPFAAKRALLEKQIAYLKETEGKFSISFSERVRPGDVIEELPRAIKANIKPEDVILYSATYGILRFCPEVLDHKEYPLHLEAIAEYFLFLGTQCHIGLS